MDEETGGAPGHYDGPTPKVGKTKITFQNGKLEGIEGPDSDKNTKSGTFINPENSGMVSIGRGMTVKPFVVIIGDAPKTEELEKLHRLLKHRIQRGELEVIWLDPNLAPHGEPDSSISVLNNDPKVGDFVELLDFSFADVGNPARKRLEHDPQLHKFRAALKNKLFPVYTIILSEIEVQPTFAPLVIHPLSESQLARGKKTPTPLQIRPVFNDPSIARFKAIPMKDNWLTRGSDTCSHLQNMPIESGEIHRRHLKWEIAPIKDYHWHVLSKQNRQVRLVDAQGIDRYKKVSDKALYQQLVALMDNHHWSTTDLKRIVDDRMLLNQLLDTWSQVNRSNPFGDSAFSENSTEMQYFSAVDCDRLLAKIEVYLDDIRSQRESYEALRPNKLPENLQKEIDLKRAQLAELQQRTAKAAETLDERLSGLAELEESLMAAKAALNTERASVDSQRTELETQVARFTVEVDEKIVEATERFIRVGEINDLLQLHSDSTRLRNRVKRNHSVRSLKATLTGDHEKELLRSLNVSSMFDPDISVNLPDATYFFLLQRAVTNAGLDPQDIYYSNKIDMEIRPSILALEHVGPALATRILKNAYDQATPQERQWALSLDRVLPESTARELHAQLVIGAFDSSTEHLTIRHFFETLEKISFTDSQVLLPGAETEVIQATESPFAVGNVPVSASNDEGLEIVDAIIVPEIPSQQVRRPRLP